MSSDPKQSALRARLARIERQSADDNEPSSYDNFREAVWRLTGHDIGPPEWMKRRYRPPYDSGVKW